MYSYKQLASAILAFSSIASALPGSLIERDTACTNTATSRQCWTNGFSTSTQADTKFPDTGKTVKVNLQVGEATLSPDGNAKKMMVFNGQYPGPAIVADWGDTIQITVTNNLPINGTGIHWHGMRQLHSNQMDGTNGITECPIVPGGSRTYTFKATQYGTSWYHSHYSVQYGDGLVGPIVINGPTTANYDIDLGALPLTDWYSEPMFELLASRPTVPPTSQSILVNGTGPQAPSTIKFTPGKAHLIRVVNTGINNNFHFGIDQHKMQVVAVDFVPVTPFTVDTLNIAVGQRYDVIVNANQTVANYVFRIGTGGGVCDGPNAQASAGTTTGAIVSYDGAGSGAPTSQALTLPSGCDDVTGINTFISTTVPSPPSAPQALALTLDTSVGVFWKVNGQSIDIDWTKPTLSYVMNGTYTLPANDNGVVINAAGWSYFLITNDTPLPHPIHLHGHDFYVIASGTGAGTSPTYTLNNPVRRDTQQIPGNNGTPGQGGYIVIAFQADNPGAWLMHCHIPFHISGGLGVQFVERPSEIVGSLGDTSIFTDGCNAWNAPANVKVIEPQPDSGLKMRKRTVRHY
ncbi:hypothetical protein BT63DRAFT_419433 [Microthyrium microscopicum]|uniref:laccase n=1 Tax=Microthyrium microscopicum TaxID=703497 RepID=A0A6A6URM7_9PEZI|nr:hypothetical protein BT63DRAFT_419433 [Microthyrium microscopicum]